MKRSTLLLLALLLCMAPLRAVLAAEEAAAANGFWDTLTRINDAVNGVVWGWPAILLLAFVGMLMTVLTRVFQVTHFRHWMKRTLGAMKDRGVMGHTADRSISQFQSLCTALAATVGTGNIVGVAGAILMGGPGAVFWMWVIAFFGMMTNYSENVLGPAAPCTICGTAWAAAGAANGSARSWPRCSRCSVSSPPSASAT